MSEHEGALPELRVGQRIRFHYAGRDHEGVIAHFQGQDWSGAPAVIAATDDGRFWRFDQERVKAVLSEPEAKP